MIKIMSVSSAMTQRISAAATMKKVRERSGSNFTARESVNRYRTPANTKHARSAMSRVSQYRYC